MFEHAVIGIDYSENLIIIKTTTGTAQGVAAVLDFDLEWQEVLGTIVEDHSTFRELSEKEQVEEVLARLTN